MLACIFAAPSTPFAATPEALRDALVRVAFYFSPRVQPVAPCAVLLDAEGLERLFGPPAELGLAMRRRAAEAGIHANIAIAHTASAALYVAAGFDGVTVIRRGEEALALSRLPLEHLSIALSAAMSERWEDAIPSAVADAGPASIEGTWRRWGLRTFGDLAALPEASVAERLGPLGARLHRIARGADNPPLLPLVPAPDFSAAQDLDDPLELLEPLLFILASLLNRICAALQARGKAASELRLMLKLQSPADKAPADFVRSLRLAVPLADPIALLKLLRMDLESHPPHAPIVGAALSAEAAAPRVVQDHLFIPPAPEPVRLEMTLARIAKLVGAENAGAAALLDTHRPDAFVLRPFRVAALAASKSKRGSGSGGAGASADSCKKNPPEPARAAAARLGFRLFRPPLRADVECSRGAPARLWARGIRGEIVALAGPWRASGDWWARDPWLRDEWDIELKPFLPTRNSGREQALVVLDGGGRRSALYRIYRELTSGAWFVEGSYD